MVECIEQDGGLNTVTLPIGWFLENGWLGEGRSDTDSKKWGNDLGFYPVNQSKMKLLTKALNDSKVEPTKGDVKPFRCKARKFFALKRDVSVEFF